MTKRIDFTDGPHYWMSSFETSHWTFEAYGLTETGAVLALKKAWAVHCKQTGADPAYLKENMDSVNSYVISIGSAYRDGDLIYYDDFHPKGPCDDFTPDDDRGLICVCGHHRDDHEEVDHD